MTRQSKKSDDYSSINISRRDAIKTTATLGALTSVAGCLGGGSGSSEGILVGELADRSGPSAVYGTPKYQAAQLAVEEINEDGGLLGEEVEMKAPDPQSSNQRYQDLARELILQDQVDVLIGGITSASREAIRPIVNENKQLYFYPEQYEGGVCDEYTFLTGAVPTQQLDPLVEYMVNEFGPNCYTLAADYNFGQISALWTRRFLDEYGGNLVNEEFIPLSVSDFGSTINRIEDSDVDWIMSLLVGGNHNSFFKQADSAGLDLPMGSSVQVGLSYGHRTLEPSSMADMHVAMNYMEEIPTERNQNFVDRFYEKFPDATYINQPAQVEYIAFKLWAQAVESAGTVNQADVHSELEKGPSLEAPEGDVTMDGGTHHMGHTVHLARVEDDHSLNFLDTFENREPTWLAERCNLDTDESTWDDPMSTQFTPDSN